MFDATPKHKLRQFFGTMWLMIRDQESRTITVTLLLYELLAIGVAVYDAYRVLWHVPFGNDVPFALALFMTVFFLVVFGGFYHREKAGHDPSYRFPGTKLGPRYQIPVGTTKNVPPPGSDMSFRSN